MPSELDTSTTDPRAISAFVHGWFAGLIEGRRGDDAALHQSIEQLNGLRLAHLEPELDAGRFRVWVEERRLKGERFGSENLERFAVLLQELVESSADPATVESNLRSVEVFQDRALETLFAVSNGTITRLGQVRPLVPSDLDVQDGLAAPSLLERLGRARALALAALACLIFCLAAFQAGWIDRVFSEDASNLSRSPGPFGTTLELELEDRWGGYVLHLRRGPKFPRSPGEAESSLASVDSPLERAAIAAVVDGSTISVQVVSGENRVLHSAAAPLSLLLVDEAARIEVELDGFTSARGVRLALAAPPVE